MMDIGIDFGTTYSSAAIMSADGSVKLVKEPLKHGSSFPSSVYAAKNGELLVGQAAENQRHMDPARYISEFKRDLGTRTPYRLGEQEVL